MSTPRGPLLLVSLTAIYAVFQAHSVKGRQDYRSPDGKLIATVVNVNKAHESRVEIRTSGGKVLLVQDFSSVDMEHGREICKAAWTHDGAFFVFSMENTGGHSPLARPTLFYSRRQNRMYDLDDTIGFITECNFKLQAPNWILTERDGMPVRVALSTLAKGHP